MCVNTVIKNTKIWLLHLSIREVIFGQICICFKSSVTLMNCKLSIETSNMQLSMLAFSQGLKDMKYFSTISTSHVWVYLGMGGLKLSTPHNLLDKISLIFHTINIWIKSCNYRYIFILSIEQFWKKLYFFKDERKGLIFLLLLGYPSVSSSCGKLHWSCCE